jgi:hypothetical protein
VVLHIRVAGIPEIDTQSHGGFGTRWSALTEQGRALPPLRVSVHFAGFLTLLSGDDDPTKRPSYAAAD